MWIYKLLRNKTRKTIVVFLVFVLPITVIFLPYVIQRFSYLKTYTLETWISLALAGSWAFLGPYFIFRYFESIKTFQNTIITLSDSSNDVTTDHHDAVHQIHPLESGLGVRGRVHRRRHLRNEHPSQGRLQSHDCGCSCRED